MRKASQTRKPKACNCEQRHAAPEDEGAAATSETSAAVTDFRFALVLCETYGRALDRIEELTTGSPPHLLLG
jgi:hypothetical protein